MDPIFRHFLTLTSAGTGKKKKKREREREKERERERKKTSIAALLKYFLEQIWFSFISQLTKGLY